MQQTAESRQRRTWNASIGNVSAMRKMSRQARAWVEERVKENQSIIYVEEMSLAELFAD